MAVAVTATIPRHRIGRRVLRVLRSLALMYLVIVLVFSLLQTKLIFQGAGTQGTAESVVTPPPGSELVRLRTVDGIPIVALFCRAQLADGSADPGSASHPTIIYFYGNAMCLNDALDECKQFRRLGANVLAVEYAGYGMSGGTPSEGNCFASAEAAYQHLLTRSDIDARKLVPAGWSLGGAVAIDLAARHAGEGHVCGVMTFSTFTSMVDVGRYHYPIFPVSFLLQHRFASEEKISKIRVPMLIVHGTADAVAPFAMSDRLAKAAGGPVARLTCEGVGHNDLFFAAEERIDQAASAFLRQF